MPEAQDTVGYSYRDGIVRIAVDHPPVNALARPVREGLHAALDRAAAEDGASSSEWETLLDASSGWPYYHNAGTGETRWELSADMGVPKPVTPAGAEAEAEAGAEAEAEAEE